MGPKCVVGAQKQPSCCVQYVVDHARIVKLTGYTSKSLMNHKR